MRRHTIKYLKPWKGEIHHNVVKKGRRTKQLTLVTTLIHAAEFSKEDTAELYGIRWNSVVDICSIKAAMNQAHVRCKSPKMVKREVWATLLAYNLMRVTIFWRRRSSRQATAADQLHQRLPVCPGFVDDDVQSQHPRHAEPLPAVTRTDRRLRSRQQTKTTGTTSHPMPKTWSQIFANTKLTS